MDGGGYKNALAVFVGTLENYGVYYSECGFIQQIIFALGGLEGIIGLGNHTLDIVAVNACGGNNIFSRVFALFGYYHVAFFNIGNLFGKMQFKSVLYGNLRKSEGVFPRRNNPCGGRVQSGGSLVGNVGLKGLKLLLVKNLKSGHSVFHAAMVKLAYGLVVLLAKSAYHRARFLEGNVQLFADDMGKLVSAHVKACGERIGDGIVARVNNGGICLCGAGGDIVFLFKERHAQIIFCKLISNGRTDNAAADNYNIKHNKHLYSSKMSGRPDIFDYVKLFLFLCSVFVFITFSF